MADITLDGSYLEGGGQIVRTAVALSALTGKAFKVENIRKNRPNPGLKMQHLHGIMAAARLCDAAVEGAEEGSSQISFSPKEISAKMLEIDIGTAGSITLLLQSLLVPMMFANASITAKIKGGTDVSWSIPADNFQNVFLPHIKDYASIKFSIVKRGYYPKGGGEVEISVKPEVKRKDFSSFEKFFEYTRSLKKMEFTGQGNITHVKGVSHASLDLEQRKVAERQAEMAKMSLRDLKKPVSIRQEYASTLSAGSGIAIWAISDTGAIIGADVLGERNVDAETVGKKCAQKLIAEIKTGCAVDSHLADNLIPFLGLFGGRIKISEITSHTRTNIYVTEKFLPVKFVIDEERKIISG